MTPIRREISVLIRYAAPIVATQLGLMTMGLVDIWMVGRLGPEAIASVALGDLWIVITMMPAFGTLLGVDPLMSQAHGARDPGRIALTLQRGIVLAIAFSVPLAFIWFHASAGLELLGQSARLGVLADDYCRAQIFSIAPHFMFLVLRQYLQSRGHMTPALWIVLIANVLNVVFNWAFIFGNLGFPALGIRGAGLATGTSRASMMVLLFLWIRLFGLHRDAWLPWSARAFELRGLVEVIRRGVPIGTHISLELWAFAACGFLAGRLGTIPLAAHTVVIKLASFSFMVPLGISIASATRIGNLIGADRQQDAQRSAWVALGTGACVMAACAGFFIALRDWLPRQFTENTTVIAAGAAILPIAAAFQLFDGLQAIGGGILRGMGNAVPAAVSNLLGYYFFALPFGWWLAFELKLGLEGLWWGLCLGLAVVAALLLTWIWCRGPAQARRVIDG